MTTGRINQVARPRRRDGHGIRACRPAWGAAAAGPTVVFPKGLVRNEAPKGREPTELAASVTKNAGEVALAIVGLVTDSRGNAACVMWPTCHTRRVRTTKGTFASSNFPSDG